MNNPALSAPQPSHFHTLVTLGSESGINARKLLAIAVVGIGASFFSTLAIQSIGGIINGIGTAPGQTPAFFPFLEKPYQLISAALGTKPKQVVFIFSGIFLLISLAHVIFRNIFSYSIAVCADRFVLHIRQKCFDRITRAERESVSAFHSGDIVHRVMTDSTQVNYLFSLPAMTIISDIVDVVWIALFMLLFDWKAFCVLAAIAPLLVYCSKRAGLRQRAFAEVVQATDGQATTCVHRTLAGLDAIKSAGGEHSESARFSAINAYSFAHRKKANFSLYLFFPLESMLRNIGIIAAVTYTAYHALNNPAAIGAIPVVFIYAQRFYAPMGNWVRYYQVIQKGLASLGRLEALLYLKQEPVMEPVPPLVYPFALHGGVHLPSGKRVHLDLTAKGPQLFLLQGESGVGKTQFLKSLMHLGVQFQGTISLAGKIVPDTRHLRCHIAYAAQEGHFLEASMAENIGYPLEPDAIDKEHCQKLLTALGLTSFSPDSCIKEYGSNLSQGEQRRVTLCRALYSNCAILLLDEIDANVGLETRKKIYAAVEEAQKNRLVLMVSHANPDELAGLQGQQITVTSQMIF